MFLGDGVRRPPLLHIRGSLAEGPAVIGKCEELYFSTLTNIITSNTTTSISNKNLLNPKHFICMFLFNLSPQVYEFSIIIPILQMGIGRVRESKYLFKVIN